MFNLRWSRLMGGLGLAACLGAPAAGQSSRAELNQAKLALQAWRHSNQEAWMNDFGNLQRYREADQKLGPPQAGEERVVFLGDSITDLWNLAGYFPGRPYINRGIDGQTTPQMLLRFRQDVIALHPKAVIILAGTNDIAGVSGPMRPADIEANYASMADLARGHHIRVIFASVTPVHNLTAKAAEFFPLRPTAEILELNHWLRQYCARTGCTYLDYFSALVGKDGFLQRQFSDDGLHPNHAGYALMAPLAEAAISRP